MNTTSLRFNEWYFLPHFVRRRFKRLRIKYNLHPSKFPDLSFCKCRQGSSGLFQKEIVSFYLRFSFTPVQFLHSGTSWISGGSPITTGRLPFRNFLKLRLLIVSLKEQFSKFESDYLVLYCCRPVRRIILVNCNDVIAIKQRCPNI